MESRNSTKLSNSSVMENVTMMIVGTESSGYREIGICSGFVLFACMCFFGNSLILLTFMKKKKLRYFGNYFLMSLSVTDLITTFNIASK